MNLRIAFCGATLMSAVALWADSSISVTTADGRRVSVEAFTPSIVKVTSLAPGEKAPRSMASVLEDAERPEVSIINRGNQRVLCTDGGLVASLNAVTGAVSIVGAAGSPLVDNGVRTVEDGRQRLELEVASGGSFYGGGERGYRFNLDGDTLVMYNRQNYGYTASDPRIRQMNITMPDRKSVV